NDLPGLYFSWKEFRQLLHISASSPQLPAPSRRLNLEEDLQREIFRLTAGHPGICHAIMCLIREGTGAMYNRYANGLPVTVRSFQEDFPTVAALASGVGRTSKNINLKETVCDPVSIADTSTTNDFRSLVREVLGTIPSSNHDS